MLSSILLLNSLKNQIYSLIFYVFTRKTSYFVKKPSTNFIFSFPKQIKSVPKPMRMWIDGHCFNIKPFKEKNKNDKRGGGLSLRGSTQEFSDINALVITTKDNGMFTTAFHLPSFYYTKLRFDNTFDLKSLINRTNTQILIPKAGQNEILRLFCDNKQRLKEATQDIHSMIGHIRNKSKPLQFIGIPLCNEDVKRNFMEFKKKVMEEKNIEGFDESIFQSPLKLHLTVNVMVLMDEREKQQAIFALKEYHTTVLKPLLKITGPLKIRVAGIECMNHNYKKVNVLFAKAKLTNESDELNLQRIVNDLSNYFYERGLLKKHQENITIHMTLINTKYRENTTNSKHSRSKRYEKRIAFDATTIMEKYKDFEFGDCDLQKIHICLMSTIGDDGFYKALSTIEV